MPAGQVKIIYTADEADAARGTVKLIKLYQQMDREAKELRKSMSKAGRAGKKAMGDAGDAAGKAAGKTKGAKRQMSAFSTATKGAAASVKAWLLGFASISVVTRGLRYMVDTMREARDLQKEMLGQTVTSEELALKTAHLYGDVSPQNLKKMEAEQIRLARIGNITKQTASQIQFFSRSAMGTEEAGWSAMKTIGKFAGPAGLSDEEVRSLPKFFKLINADTEKKQMEALEGLYGATKGSITMVGEMIDPFLKLLGPGLGRGFSWEQLLSRHMGLLETLGPERAAQAGLIVGEVTGGKTKKAQDWFSKLGKERGVDWREMSGPERYEFMREYYREIKDDTKKVDEMTLMLGGARGSRVVRYAFGEASEKHEAFTLKKIEEAKGSGVIEKMYKEFGESTIALSRKLELGKQIAETEMGRQKAKMTYFNQHVETIHRLALADTDTAAFRRRLPSKELQKSAVAHKYMQDQLRGIQPGEPGYEEAQDMARNAPASYTLNQKYVEKAYDLTKGFSIGGKTRPAQSYYPDATEDKAWGGGFRAFYEMQAKLDEAANEQTTVQKETLGVLKEIRDKLPEQPPPGAPSGEPRSGNMDQ